MSDEVIIFDLDDTLRTVPNDAPVPSDPSLAKNWVEWQKYVNEHGTPNQPIVDLYHAIYESDVDIVILTSSQFGTLEWLTKHDINIPDGIIERKPDDNRSGLEYKTDFIAKNKHEIKLWVDDDYDVLGIAKIHDLIVLDVGYTTL